MSRPWAWPPSLAVLALVALAALPARAQFAGFTWELKGGVSGSGTVEPDHLHIVGPDDPSDCTSGDGETTWLQTVAPMAGHVSAVVEYITLDDWPSYKLFDAPAWVIDGTVHIPPSGEGWPNGTYTLEFDVLPQQTFGFGVWAADCAYGPGIADVVELVFSPAEWFVLGAPIDPQLGPQVSGTRLGPAGDVNGDGHDDFLTGKQGGGGTPGTVRLRSGVDGSVLFEQTGEKLMGYAVAGGGDFDADGVPDFAGGEPAQSTVTDGRIVAWSGATGDVIFEVADSPALDALGGVLASVGDTDGDGFEDLAASSGGQVYDVAILGGPDGHLLAKHASGASKKDNFGSAIAGVGDADLDGFPDVLVGAPAVDGPALLNARAYLYSGATGALLLTLEGEKKQFGLSVSAAGDADGDGRADLLVADPMFAPDGVHIGRYAIFSGLDGTLLKQVTGTPSSVLAGTTSGGRDLSGDGVADIVGAVWLPDVALRVYSGADSSLVHEFVVPGEPGFSFQVAIVGDIGGDGPADAGIATAIGSFLVKALDGLGAPHLVGSGDVAGNALILLTVDHGRAGAPALLVVGATGLSLPLLGGVLVPSPGTLVPFMIGDDGGALLHGRWPPGMPAGTSAWLQAWIVDPAGPAGWTCTNGLIAGQLGS